MPSLFTFPQLTRSGLWLLIITFIVVRWPVVLASSENQTVTAFDPAIIYGGSWKTNGSHGISHKNSKSGGAFANFSFVGSAIYYTGEISSKATPVRIFVDSVAHPVLNISSKAKAKGMKSSASDVEILFSVTGLDAGKTHTWSMQDVEDGKGTDKFLTLYRLTVTTGSSTNTTKDEHTSPSTEAMPQATDFESALKSSGSSHGGTIVGAVLGSIFGLAALILFALIFSRRYRTIQEKQSVLLSVSPFIARSVWWQIAAGERLAKVVTPQGLFSQSKPGPVTGADDHARVARAAVADATEVQSTIGPPPEYRV